MDYKISEAFTVCNLKNTAFSKKLNLQIKVSVWLVVVSYDLYWLNQYAYDYENDLWKRVVVTCKPYTEYVEIIQHTKLCHINSICYLQLQCLSLDLMKGPIPWRQGTCMWFGLWLLPVVSCTVPRVFWCLHFPNYKLMAVSSIWILCLCFLLSFLFAMFLIWLGMRSTQMHFSQY